MARERNILHTTLSSDSDHYQVSDHKKTILGEMNHLSVFKTEINQYFIILYYGLYYSLTDFYRL